MHNISKHKIVVKNLYQSVLMNIKFQWTTNMFYNQSIFFNHAIIFTACDLFHHSDILQ